MASDPTRGMKYIDAFLMLVLSCGVNGLATLGGPPCHHRKARLRVADSGAAYSYGV
jgi:hypothetical protein